MGNLHLRFDEGRVGRATRVAFSPTLPPPPRYENAAEGRRSPSSSADEFQPVIPRSGCSPAEPVSASPARTDYHALLAAPGKRRHFYFAEKATFLLCVDTIPTLP